MPETVPEIQRCNLSNVVLYLKVLGVEDVLGFDYFEAPSKEQLGEALLMLHSLGALDEAGQVRGAFGPFDHPPIGGPHGMHLSEFHPGDGAGPGHVQIPP